MNDFEIIKEMLKRNGLPFQEVNHNGGKTYGIKKIYNEIFIERGYSGFVTYIVFGLNNNLLDIEAGE